MCFLSSWSLISQKNALYFLPERSKLNRFSHKMKNHYTFSFRVFGVGSVQCARRNFHQRRVRNGNYREKYRNIDFDARVFLAYSVLRSFTWGLILQKKLVFTFVII